MTAKTTLVTRLERWRFTHPFRISGYEWSDMEVGYVEVERNGMRGRGECAGVYYKNDPPRHALDEIARVESELARGLDRESLLELLPPGGARNGVDCALWDLEAKERKRPVWQLAGVPQPRALTTTYTIGSDDPEQMAQRAREFADARALKLKLTGTGQDGACVRAVRAARPDVWLGVDANQGFTRETLGAVMPALVECGVQVIEQPFALDRDADMEGLNSPIPVAADESAQTAEDLPRLAGRFDVVNIKLDKCGGLTAGLAMARRARELGFKVMVGNMAGTSLAMAPAFVLGQLCDIVDLDGPLLFEADRAPSAEYREGRIWCSDSVWGGAA